MLGLAGSTGTDWKKGATPRASTLRAIADYFGVSVEYLTNDEDVIQTLRDNHKIIGNANPVIIINGNKKTLTDQETALLNIFAKLDVVNQSKLITFAAELMKKD